MANDSLNHALHPDVAARQERRQLLFALAATLAATAYLFFWTLGTSPILGDESRYFRRATNYYEAPLARMRVTHDPAYPATGPAAIQYWGSSLWHLGLALIWKIIGHRSLLAAQFYQSAYFFLLSIASYLTARELAGHRAGLWAALLLLTIPMNILFGMTFYLEIPVLAFAALAVCALVAARPILFGLALGAMYLTKAPSAAVIAPPLLAAAVLLIGHTWRQRLLRLPLVLAAFAVVVLPDVLWHMHHFGRPFMFRSAAHSGTFYPETINDDLNRIPSPRQSAIPFPVFSLYALVQMFGATGLVILLVAFVLIVIDLLRTAWDSVCSLRSEGLLRTLADFPDHCPPRLLVLGLPLLFYVVAYVVMLRRSYDVRYLQPVTLFAAALVACALPPMFAALRQRLAARGASARAVRWLPRAGVTLIAAVCVGQLLAVPPVVHRQRRLDPRVSKAYDWIEHNTQPDARFLYLEENLTTITGRPIIWAIITPRYFFTVSERRQAQLLAFTRINYIAITPDPRRHGPDATLLQEVTAYPESWIRSLAARPYLALVYPPDCNGNPDDSFLIYRVDWDKIPKDWLDEIRPHD